jgi:hypothetical protein
MLALGVGHLDADGRPSRDRGQDAHVHGGHGVGDVLLEVGHLGHLDPGTELQLVARHGRADGHTHQPGLDAVGGQGVFEGAAEGLDHATVDLDGLGPFEQGQRREAPGPGLGGGAEADAQLDGRFGGRRHRHRHGGPGGRGTRHRIGPGLGRRRRRRSGRVVDGGGEGLGGMGVEIRGRIGGSPGAGGMTPRGGLAIGPDRPVHHLPPDGLDISADEQDAAADHGPGGADRGGRDEEDGDDEQGDQDQSCAPAGQGRAQRQADAGAEEPPGAAQDGERRVAAGGVDVAGRPGDVEDPADRHHDETAAKSEASRVMAGLGAVPPGGPVLTVPGPDQHHADQDQRGRHQYPAPAQEVGTPFFEGAPGRSGQVAVDAEPGEEPEHEQDHPFDVVRLTSENAIEGGAKTAARPRGGGAPRPRRRGPAPAAPG